MNTPQYPLDPAIAERCDIFGGLVKECIELTKTAPPNEIIPFVCEGLKASIKDPEEALRILAVAICMQAYEIAHGEDWIQKARGTRAN